MAEWGVVAVGVVGPAAAVGARLGPHDGYDRDRVGVWSYARFRAARCGWESQVGAQLCVLCRSSLGMEADVAERENADCCRAKRGHGMDLRRVFGHAAPLGLRTHSRVARMPSVIVLVRFMRFPSKLVYEGYGVLRSRRWAPRQARPSATRMPPRPARNPMSIRRGKHRRFRARGPAREVGACAKSVSRASDGTSMRQLSDT